MSLPIPTVLTQTSDPTKLDGRPCFSPDGTTVLLMRQDLDVTSRQPYRSTAKRSDFYQVPIATPGTEQLYCSVSAYGLTRPDWSWHPGTDHIAFTPGFSTANNQFGLLKAKSNTQAGRAKLVTVKGYVGSLKLSYPSWYPDGKHLALTNYANNVLIKVSKHGKWRQDLTDASSILAGMCSVDQQHDKHLCTAAQQPSSNVDSSAGPDYDQGNNNIYVQRRNEAPVRFSAAPPAVSRAPWWSPDGKWIAYEGKSGSGPYQVYLQRKGQDASQAQVVTDADFGVQHPKWSPDGKSIVYAASTVQPVPNNPVPAQILMIDVSGYL